MIVTDRHKSFDIYELYDSYKTTLKESRKVLRKRQGINAEIRDTKKEPHKRNDYNKNVNDITHWNSMIGDLEEDMRAMEMSMDFEDRELLHRDYYNMKSMILNRNSYEGEIHIDGVCDVVMPNVEDVICDIEFQNDVKDLIGRILTDRQMKMVYMYFWEDMTQEEISIELGIAQKNVSVNLQNVLKLLKKYISYDEMCDF